MIKKYVIVDTSSTEEFNEIRSHLLEYGIESREPNNPIPNVLPFGVLSEQSELIKKTELTGTVYSKLIVELVENTGSETVLVKKGVYMSSVHGSLLLSVPESTADPKPYGWDARFIPDGLMKSYYHLKKQGLRISPSDKNIKQFLQDYVHNNDQVVKVNLEIDYGKVLFDLFDINAQKDFVGYQFWKKIINSVVSGGFFNEELIDLSQGGQKIHVMRDIFHYLVPDLLYTGNFFNKKNYELSYVLHRIVIECFALVFADMFYVHYLVVNGCETTETSKFYAMFEAIYGKRTDVFNGEIMQEVMRASAIYGLYGYDAGFIALFVKYNGSYKLDNYRNLLKSFRSEYAHHLIPDLKLSVHNVSYMKKHSRMYEYLANLESITKRFGIITVDNAEAPDKLDVNYFVDIGFKQLRTALSREIFPPNTILKNKFLHWVLVQLRFFEHYAGIPIVDGNKEKFYELVGGILTENHIPITLNKIRYFRYQWSYLMEQCANMQVITLRESKEYEELFPILDPNYISPYVDILENRSEIMTNFLDVLEF